MARRAARVDSNQAEIVEQLRALGFHVTLLHMVGGGVPDIVVTGYSNVVWDNLALFVEIKTETGKLTAEEEAWFAGFPPGGPAIIARSVDDVLEWFGRN